MRCAALLIAVAVTSGGCKAKRHDESPPTPAVVAVKPLGPAPKLIVPFTKQPAPPIPFDRFRPHMSRPDFVAMVADAGLVASNSALPTELAVPTGTTVYALSLRETFGYFELDPYSDRLTSIVIIGTKYSNLEPQITSHWGRGEQVGAGLRTYSAPESGWRISLKEESEQVTLTFEASDSPADAGLAKPDPQLWADLAGVVGKPLEAARPIFGAALVKERDRNPQAEQSDHRQGYARIATPWDDAPWEIAFDVDPSSETVATLTITGRTDTEEARIALIASLKAAYGPLHTVISDAGRIEIACETPVVEVRLGDSADEWTIAVRASPRI